MKTIKFFQKDSVHLALVDNILYTGFTIGFIPARCFGLSHPNNPESEGTSEWFNHLGLTYYQKPVAMF